MILTFDETKTLIQDYLNYVDVIDFDNRKTNSNNEISLKSSDLVELQEIMESEEFKKLMANRFVDGLKDLLKNNGIENYKTIMKLGEYREILNTVVSYLKISKTDVVYNPIDVSLMEDKLGPSIKYLRNEALKDICFNVPKEEKNEIPSESTTNRSTGSDFDEDISSRENLNGNNYSDYDSIENEHLRNNDMMQLITFNKNKNQEYKNAVATWNNFSKEILSITGNGVEESVLRENIREVHENISKVTLEGLSKWVNIEAILMNDQATLKNDIQKRVQSNFFKLIKESGGSQIFNTKLLDEDLKSYRNAVQKRYNTVYNNLKQHMEYSKKQGLKQSFNVNEAIRLILYIETGTLFEHKITKGKITNFNFIPAYRNAVIDMKNFLTKYNNDTSYESLHLVHSIIAEDLISTSNIEAMHLFTSVTKNIQETLPAILNNSNYNYASLALPELINGFIDQFNEFINNNQKSNRNVNETSITKTTTLPNFEELHVQYKPLSEMQNTLRTTWDYLDTFNKDQEKLLLSLLEKDNLYK